MLPLLRCFFAHLLILQYPDHHQNLISSYLYYSGPVHKISSQSVHNFLSNVVHRQTNKQTNQRYQKHNLLCQGGKNIVSKSNVILSKAEMQSYIICKLEALRERRPPWLRQIITLILPTVKMLSLGCERLPTPLKKKFWIITCTTILVCYCYYGVFLLIYSSYNAQITTKI